MNVTFPTSVSTEILDGTQASNQVSVAASSLTISNWPPGAALWLTWQAQTLGSAQNLAIDNLSFSVVGAPTVATTAASSITPVSAKLTASINSGGATTTNWFEYGQTLSYGSVTSTNTLSAGGNAVSVTNLISGLQPNATYHFRAIAANSFGTILGNDLSFVTSPVNPPQLGSVQILGNGDFKFSFTNSPGVSFSVLTSTNVALPVNQWQIIGAPSESPAGQYQFIDTPATNTQRYYLIRQP